MGTQELTPMLAQYHRLKSQYPDCLLLFRLGDFYELFYEDALVGSKELGLVLTSRPAGKGRERIPMCGVPYHSAQSYIQKLVNKGYKVAICEQVEDPSKAKGLVRREVVRVITPGTFFEKGEGGLLALWPAGRRYWVGYLNLAVGDFVGAKVKKEELTDFVSKLPVKEVLLPEGEELPPQLRELFSLHETRLPVEFFEEGARRLREEAGPPSSLGFGEEEAYLPLGALLLYAKNTQKNFVPFVRKPKPYADEGHLRLDYKAVRGLELLESIEGRKDFSLFKVLNHTLTAMGRRRLRFYLLNPLRSLNRIEALQEAVEELKEKRKEREELRSLLEGMADLERLVSRISSGMASPRELVSLKKALFKVGELKEALKKFGSPLLRELREGLSDLTHLAEEIDRVLVEEPPLHVKEGGLIKEGVDPYLEELRFVKENAERLLKEYEEKLRRETGIQSLKVGYNKVMGYYIEVTKANLKRVPPYFRRRQTLSQGERFTTDELMRLEEKILSAKSRINELEYEIYKELREKVLKELEKVGSNALLVGEADYLQSLAHLADLKGWVRPKVHEGYRLLIEEGRHPLIEAHAEHFVPNDTLLTEEAFVHVITGPNMAGKSSYIRQVAVLTLLAHMGSFLPVKRAEVPLTDALYARIGSGDLLAMGVSTFMNEMLEVANILNNATERSLVVLDEVGRGTSTYDGIAISKAIVKYLSGRVKAKTLLATHYLELTHLEGEVEGVKNYHMEVERTPEGVRFLYMLKEGKAEGSFGVEVAKLAGLPEEVVEEARRLLRKLEESQVVLLEESFRRSEESHRLDELSALLEEVAQLDIENTTPLKALLILSQLKEKAKKALREKV